jgi:hypothetical protein
MPQSKSAKKNHDTQGPLGALIGKICLNLAITHREHDLGKQENAVGIEVGSKHNYTWENHGFYMNFNLDPFIKSNLQVGLWFEFFFT